MKKLPSTNLCITHEKEFLLRLQIAMLTRLKLGSSAELSGEFRACVRSHLMSFGVGVMKARFIIIRHLGGGWTIRFIPAVNHTGCDNDDTCTSDKLASCGTG